MHSLATIHTVRTCYNLERKASMAVVYFPYGKEELSLELPDQQLQGILVSRLHNYRAERSELELVKEGSGQPSWVAPAERAGKGQKKDCHHSQRSHPSRTQQSDPAAYAGRNSPGESPGRHNITDRHRLPPRYHPGGAGRKIWRGYCSAGTDCCPRL